MVKIIKTLGLYALVILFAAGLLILATGLFPGTFAGWMVILLLALPSLLFSWLGERLFSERMSRRIDASTKALSFRRMLYAFIVALMTSGTVIATLMLTKGFWGPHFHKF